MLSPTATTSSATGLESGPVGAGFLIRLQGPYQASTHLHPFRDASADTGTVRRDPFRAGRRGGAPDGWIRVCCCRTGGRFAPAGLPSERVCPGRTIGGIGRSGCRVQDPWLGLVLARHEASGRVGVARRFRDPGSTRRRGRPFRWARERSRSTSLWTLTQSTDHGYSAPPLCDGRGAGSRSRRAGVLSSTRGA